MDVQRPSGDDPTVAGEYPEAGEIREEKSEAGNE